MPEQSVPFFPDSLLIESARLRIQPLVEADASDLCATVSSPTIKLAVYILRNGLSQTQAKDLIKDNSSTNVLCGIWLKPEGPLIGAFRLHLHDSGHDNGAVEVGYWLDIDWHGQGFAKESLKSVLAYLKGHEQKPEVIAECDPTNAPSQAILLNNGFRCTGEAGKRPGRERYQYSAEDASL